LEPDSLEPESKPAPHRVTAPVPAPPKLCGNGSATLHTTFAVLHFYKALLCSGLLDERAFRSNNVPELCIDDMQIDEPYHDGKNQFGIET
jgi:hypothetical protein